MVFQSYALYPHMTVADNMAFSLKLRKADPKVMSERVAHASKILNLDPYLHRYPRELSGGQRQRVAMGRAIVRDPKVFLFDEPLSNLDAKLRVAMRAEIKALHQRLTTTTVYVTHDQVEAMTMADRIVVMHDGRIEQIGTPLGLYDHPDNLFVAQFIGSPAMNVINGKVKRANGSACVEVPGGVRWPLQQGPGADGQAVAYGIRPGDLRLADRAAADTVPGEIVVVEPTGAETELLIQVGEAQVILVTHGRPAVNPGDRVGLAVDPGKVHAFDASSGARLSA
jgi:multiple sugar transport system ATP-binding protein